MSTARARWEAAVGVIQRDALLFWSYRLRAVSQTLAVFFSLTLFYFVSKLVNVASFREPGSYFAFVAVGLLILTVLTATMAAVPLGVRQELVAGTFERFVVSPMGAAAGVSSMLVFPLASSIAIATVQLCLAVVVFGLDVEWPSALLGAPVALLAALSFTPIAVLLVAAVVVVKQVGGGVTFITTAFAFVGGFFFPPQLLPDWIEWASDAQPFTPALELLRHVLLGTSLTESAAVLVLKLILFALLLLPLSALVLRRAIESSRRRGTLIEY